MGGRMKAAEKIEPPEEKLAVIQYNITDSAIAKMKEKYKGLKITDLKDTKGYEEVRLAIADVRTRRTAVEDKRVELKKDALEFGRKVDKEAKRITALLLKIEDPLKAEKKRIDDEADRIKEEKARKEQERVDGIRARITQMQSLLLSLPEKTTPELNDIMDNLLDCSTPEEIFMEFMEEATTIREQTIEAVSRQIEVREKLDKEEAERKAEAERLAKQKAEQEAEAARLAAEKKAQEEAAAKIKAEQEAEAKRLEDERRKIQEEKDRAEFERKAKEKAEAEARAKVEREEKERTDREAKAAKEEADRKAAEALEKARQEALRPDKEKILSFLDEIAAVMMPVVDGKADELLQEIGKSIRKLLAKARKDVEAL